jgi:hypothetical protein
MNTFKDGYYDKECPNKECLFHFKVNEEDWKNIFKDENVFCPICRYEANAKSWYTTDQLNIAKDQILQHIEGRIGKAFAEGANDLIFHFQTKFF